MNVDESKAVDLVLRPGEMSLHHIGIVHGSSVNRSDKPRIGVAIRYLSPDVIQAGNERPLAMLVRGQDSFGHFDLVDPPQQELLLAEGAMPEAVRRAMKSVMPKGWNLEGTPADGKQP